MSRAHARVAAMLLLAAAAPARAEGPPACSAEMVGSVACFERVLCACGFQRGGAMTGLPTGYRWDCGIMRPPCGGGPDTPATTGGYQGPLPDAIGLERNSTVINTQTGAGASNGTEIGGRRITVMPRP